MIIHLLSAYGNKANNSMVWESFLAAENRNTYTLYVCTSSVCVCVHATILLLCSWIQLLQAHAKQWIVLDLLWHDYETIICTDEYFAWSRRLCEYVCDTKGFHVAVHTPKRNEFDDKFTEMETYSIDRQI